MTIWWVGVAQYVVTAASGEAGRSEVEAAIGPRNGVNPSFIYDTVDQLVKDVKQCVDLRKTRRMK